MRIKAKSLLEKLANDLDIPKELAEDVINFYYSELRRKLESMEHSRVRVTEIGVLYASRKKLEDSIATLKHLLKTDKPETFKQVKRANEREKLIEIQNKLLEKIYKEREEYESKKDMERKK